MTEPRRGEVFPAEQAMRLAILEAAKGAAFTAPNPNVGCVVLDARGGFLSKGHHERFGGPHAEVNALRGLSGAELKGAQVFVTLEPCAHEGKTPSCAKMLAALPLGRVVYGLVDPNPLVSGQGAAIVRAAGVACDLYAEKFGRDLDDDLEASCEIFLWNQRHRKPFVTLKAAASLDGRVALADGSSRWITGPEARERGHELRASHDVVLIGAGTLDRDDPRLDVRHPRISKRNKVAVLDADARRLNDEWNLADAHSTDEIFWFVAPERAAPTSAKAAVLAVSRAPAGLDLQAVLDALWDRGVRSVLVEGGARLSGSFLAAGLVNRLELFVAPTILGGTAKSWSDGFVVENMAEKPILSALRWHVRGRDLELTGWVRNPRTGVVYRDA